MESKSKLWYFENFNLFHSLGKEEMEKLSRMAAMKSCTKHQIIYFPQESANAIYFLKTGKVKISKYSFDGREMIIAMLGPGEIFGELALAGQNERNEIAEAIDDSIVCSIDIRELENMLQSNPQLNLQITKLIGLRLRKFESRLESLVFKNAEERIHGFIKEMAKEHGRKIGNEVEVNLRLTHEDIAKLTATSRQTVTAVFSELEKKNIILYDRKRILVKNLQALS